MVILKVYLPYYSIGKYDYYLSYIGKIDSIIELTYRGCPMKNFSYTVDQALVGRVSTIDVKMLKICDTFVINHDVIFST